MKAYSLDLRSRIFADVDRGMGTREVALKYDVSESWVRRLKQRRRETGEVEARSRRNTREPKWVKHCDEIERLVEERPDITLRELRDELQVDISLTSLHRALKHLQFTFKKK